MKRQPEPELMEDPAQVHAYAATDFSSSDTAFINAALDHFKPLPQGRMIDLGCGPGNMCLPIARRRPKDLWTGLDGSSAMLKIARRRAEDIPNLTFKQAILPDETLPEAAFDGIISNSVLHHLHNPDILWQTIKKIGKKRAHVFVGDLLRPQSDADIERLKACYLADAHPIVLQDFHASLRAAFRIEEIEAQLKRADLEHFQVLPFSDRHVVIRGIL